jgi:ankyrin repeat protein
LVAAKTFSWVAIAKRPLTLDELREAISIEIGQQHSISGRLVNGIDQLASWCENLVHVDEELKTVQFAHQAIHKFIVEGPPGPQFRNFCFNLPDADHHAGEICVTYLDFNDFKRTLTRRSQPMKVDPVAMAKLALSRQLKAPSAIAAFGLRSRSQSHKSKAEVDVVRVLSGCKDGEQGIGGLEQDYPFLKYASIHWISHTSRFRKTSRTWGLWYQMITCGHDLAERPWPEQHSFNALAPDLLTWSLQPRHFGLIRLIESAGGIYEPENQQKTWRLVAQVAQRDAELLDVLLEGNYALQIIIATLQEASKSGHFEVVERLLAMGKTNIHAKDGLGRTPLHWAARGAYEAVVKLLFVTGNADVDTKDNDGQTPLHYAATRGHVAVVKLLLAKLLLATGKADVDTKDNDGQTPLHCAAIKGHTAVVKLLLATGKADVDTEDILGRTPLHWAAREGHEAVVKLLLTTGKADIDTKDVLGRTPLHYAATRGSKAVVKLLLATGKADVDPKDNDGRTPLYWAAKKGHMAVVELLSLW